MSAKVVLHASDDVVEAAAKTALKNSDDFISAAKVASDIQPSTVAKTLDLSFMSKALQFTPPPIKPSAVFDPKSALKSVSLPGGSSLNPRSATELTAELSEAGKNAAKSFEVDPSTINKLQLDELDTVASKSAKALENLDDLKAFKKFSDLDDVATAAKKVTTEAAGAGSIPSKIAGDVDDVKLNDVAKARGIESAKNAPDLEKVLKNSRGISNAVDGGETIAKKADDLTEAATKSANKVDDAAEGLKAAKKGSAAKSLLLNIGLQGSIYGAFYLDKYVEGKNLPDLDVDEPPAIFTDPAPDPSEIPGANTKSDGSLTIGGTPLFDGFTPSDVLDVVKDPLFLTVAAVVIIFMLTPMGPGTRKKKSSVVDQAVDEVALKA